MCFGTFATYTLEADQGPGTEINMRRTDLTKSMVIAALAVCLSAGAASAAGDAKKGEKVFKKCKACHSLEEGKKKVGPSRYQIVGKQAGTVDGYKYSKSYVLAGEKGLMWTAENLIAYLEDPKKFMRDYLDDKKAKSKMVMKFKKIKQRENVVAFLESLQSE